MAKRSDRATYPIYCIADIFTGLNFSGCSYSCITEIICGLSFRGTRPIPTGDMHSLALLHLLAGLFFVEGSHVINRENCK